MTLSLVVRALHHHLHRQQHHNRNLLTLLLQLQLVVLMEVVVVVVVVEASQLTLNENPIPHSLHQNDNIPFIKKTYMFLFTSLIDRRSRLFVVYVQKQSVASEKCLSENGCCAF